MAMEASQGQAALGCESGDDVRWARRPSIQKAREVVPRAGSPSRWRSGGGVVQAAVDLDGGQQESWGTGPPLNLMAKLESRVPGEAAITCDGMGVGGLPRPELMLSDVFVFRQPSPLHITSRSQYRISQPRWIPGT